MAKFNVGDIVVGNDKDKYIYTTDRCVCKVIKTYEPGLDGKDMRVEAIYHADGHEVVGEKWDVDSRYFDRVIAAPVPAKKTKKTKEMTVSEISKALGYDVKIVKESRDEYYF